MLTARIYMISFFVWGANSIICAFEVNICTYYIKYQLLHAVNSFLAFNEGRRARKLMIGFVV